MPNSSHIYAFTLESIMIASYDITADTYGTPYNLDADQILDFDPQSDTDMMRDSGAVSRLLAVMTHANFTITQGGMDPIALGIITNGVSGESYWEPEAGKGGLKYFGVLGVASLDNDGVIVGGLRACKLDTAPMLKFDGQANKFTVSDMKGKSIAVAGSGVNRILRFKRYASLTAWNAVRPADGTAFGTWLKAVNGA
jgi:hypothetical protein